MEEFADIRPYKDGEVPVVLQRLLADAEFIDAICSLKFKWAAPFLCRLLRPLVRRALSAQLAGVEDVAGFQKVIERYMSAMIENSTEGFTVSGLEQLEPGSPYLFMSNHRDITLDPAFTNYALYHNGHDTVRIAIGDNLLTKPYVSDLMRLNKSFIVKRSAKGPRHILKAYRDLSAYIRHSICMEHAPIWIAQREGRAKDGLDRTEPAIIKMLAMSQDKQSQAFAEHIASLHIVPVSISYELDPCDGLKAVELLALAEQGTYRKGEHEDVASIATGISGSKGYVHVAFGAPLRGNLETPAAVAAALDRGIIGNYVLFDTNLHAYRRLYGESAPLPQKLQVQSGSCTRAQFQQRIDSMPAEQRDFALAIYANAVVSKLGLEEGGAVVALAD